MFDETEASLLQLSKEASEPAACTEAGTPSGHCGGKGRLDRPTGAGQTTARLGGQVGAEDYALLRRFAGHSDEVTSVAFSPDSSKVLSGSKDKTAQLWEAISGKLLAIFQGHEGSVESVAFSFDGSEVMTASMDGTVRLWEATSGRQVAVLLGHFGDMNSMQSMVFSSKSSRLVTGLYNGDAQTWEVGIGKLS